LASFRIGGGADGRNVRSTSLRMGTFTGDKRTVARNLKERLQRLSGLLEPEEVAAFENMLRAMLRLEPKERVSADEIARMLPSAWV
jgi:hypothetical protein